MDLNVKIVCLAYAAALVARYRTAHPPPGRPTKAIVATSDSRPSREGPDRAARHGSSDANAAESGNPEDKKRAAKKRAAEEEVPEDDGDEDDDDDDDEEVHDSRRVLGVARRPSVNDESDTDAVTRKRRGRKSETRGRQAREKSEHTPSPTISTVRTRTGHGKVVLRARKPDASDTKKRAPVKKAPQSKKHAKKVKKEVVVVESDSPSYHSSESNDDESVTSSSSESNRAASTKKRAAKRKRSDSSESEVPAPPPRKKKADKKKEKKRKSKK